MPQVTLIWAALGMLIGITGVLAGARSAYPRGEGRRATLGRWALAIVAVALVAVIAGWLAAPVVGMLAASAAACGLAALAALVWSLWSQYSATPNTSTTHDAPASQ